MSSAAVFVHSLTADDFFVQRFLKAFLCIFTLGDHTAAEIGSAGLMEGHSGMWMKMPRISLEFVVRSVVVL